MTLQESEESFRRVFEEGPLGLALVGKDYRFVKVNAALCQMVGYSEASLLQMSFADITYPDDLRADVELAERLFRDEIPFYALAMIEDITEVKHAREVEDRLASDLAASRDEIRALAASLMRAQEDERRRVSRELHDQICNQLACLAFDISRIAVGLPAFTNVRTELEAIHVRIVKTSQDTHQIAYQMHTAVLDDLGLVASLKALCGQFAEHYPGIALDFKDCGVPTLIPDEVASCLYRVAQESLQNIAKHSHARFASVRLGFEKAAVLLTIQDDGAGFDPKAIKGHGGLGLISMEERARSVEGRLTITSQPGHDTQIHLEILLPTGNS